MNVNTIVLIIVGVVVIVGVAFLLIRLDAYMHPAQEEKTAQIDEVTKTGKKKK